VATPPSVSGIWLDEAQDPEEGLQRFVRVFNQHSEAVADALDGQLTLDENAQVQWHTTQIVNATASSTAIASATCSASYGCTTAQSIPNTTPTVINFDTADFDTDAAVTTGTNWRFVVPAGKAGKYVVATEVMILNAAASDVYVLIGLFKNGIEVKRLARSNLNTIQTVGIGGCTTVALAAGDYIDIRLAHGYATARTLEAAGAVLTQKNWISITKVAG
jgi:hypothetical protein